MKKKITKKKDKLKKGKIKKFLDRRPHRSFRLTRRRDYDRSLKLPGYFAFSKYVFKILWTNRKIFLLMALLYATLSLIMVGITSQDTYLTLQDTLKSTGGSILNGGWGELGKSFLLFITTISVGASDGLSDVQQIYSIIIILLTWLTSVWLLRNIIAGRKVRLRDGLYNSGAPIFPTFLIALLFLFQLLPFAIAIIGYSAASTTGFLSGGIEAMLFWVVAGLLTIMSLYFIIGTLFALIIITLPGMYPSVAIKTAGDMVVGRRFRILKRLIWMLMCVLISWIVIIIPLIIFDSWIKNMWKAINWIPSIPIIILLLSSISIIWISAYIYLLYRKVVDDGAEPA